MMRISLAAVAACATLGSSPAWAKTPLDPLISFSDPHRCETSGEFHTLLDGLVQWEEVGETYAPILKEAAIPAPFRARSGKPHLSIDGRDYRATLPLSGTWQGLPIRSVVVAGQIESEQGFYLVLEATPA